MFAFMPWAPRRAADAAGGRAAVEGDAALAAAVAACEPDALERLYRREAAAVYRYALALGGNAAWAADATQEAFLGFVDRASAFDAARGSLGAYLAGMARHHLLGLWRESPPPSPEGEATEPLDEADPESLLVARQSSDALWAALARLPWPQREALVLVDLQQRAYAEAAAIAGVELNTLRTRLHRARARLAQALRGEPVAVAGVNP